MLTIEVTTIGGSPPPVPMTARFDEAGGAIGRDAGCTLVLPDPEKRISRSHCLVSFEAGRYVVRNQGSALPLLLNDVPVPLGAQAPLGDGDRLVVGDYGMVVHDSGARAPAAAAAVAPAAPAARRATAPAVAHPDDILADFGPAGAADPFADLIPRATAPLPASVIPAKPAPVPMRAPSAASLQIPDDFDPFADAAAVATADEPQRAEDALDAAVPARKASVDDLFGLKSAPLFPPGHPLAPGSASSTPGPVGIDDLLQTRPGKAPIAPVQRDDASELSTPMRLPQLEAVAEPAVAPAVAAPAQARAPAPVALPISAAATATPPPAPNEMKLSWEEGAHEGLFDGMRSVLITAQPDVSTTGARRGDVAPAATESASKPVPAKGALDPALLSALLDGLGLERWPAGNDVDADAMRRLGRLLRSAVRGTIDLLRARATIKSEVQAEMTMVVDVDNNPLKFSPNVDAALAHLLGPAQRGFIEGTAAMDDAYRDLVAHQFGFTAGTRAAIEAMLARFDPATLQQRLTSKTVLDSVLPDHRKAKLWALFTERYSQIAGEAEDDFQRLFGKAFLRAYEEQVAKLSERASAEKA